MKKIILILIYSLFWRNFLKIIIGVKYYNQSILSSKKQFILIANHNSHIDTMAIMSAIPSRYIHRVHPIAAEDFFGGSKSKKFLMRYLVNATLIPRSRTDDEENDPVNIMGKLLKKGRSIVLYPEGSRGVPGILSEFKKGLGYLVQRYPNVDVIPVYLDGLHKTLPKGSRLILPFNSKIIFGKKINFESYDIDDILNDAQKGLTKINKDIL